MARYDYYRRSERHMNVLDPAHAFFVWLADIAEGIYGEAEKAFAMSWFCWHEERGEAEATCLMDYLYVWLDEGDATQRCADFEDWLMTVIAIIDRVGRGGSGFVYPGEEHHIDLEWAQNPERHGRQGANLRLPILDAEMDLQHPALDRAVFKRCQRRSAARRR